MFESPENSSEDRDHPWQLVKRILRSGYFDHHGNWRQQNQGRRFKSNDKRKRRPAEVAA